LWGGGGLTALLGFFFSPPFGEGYENITTTLGGSGRKELFVSIFFEKGRNYFCLLFFFIFFLFFYMCSFLRLKGVAVWCQGGSGRAGKCRLAGQL